MGAFLLFRLARGIRVGLALFLLDVALLLFNRGVVVRGERFRPGSLTWRMSTAVKLEIENRSRLPLLITLIDELPYQFQIRDFENTFETRESSKGSVMNFTGRAREYVFGAINAFLASIIGLVERRLYHTPGDARAGLSVHPSDETVRAACLRPHYPPQGDQEDPPHRDTVTNSNRSKLRARRRLPQHQLEGQ